MKPNNATVTIIGAGTMGHALAIVFAKGGLEVRLADKEERKLVEARELIRAHLDAFDRAGEPGSPPAAAMERIMTSTDWRPLVRDASLVVEAIVEDVEEKRTLYHELARWIGDGAILASNTSYLDVFPLAPDSLQERFVITHFFSPPYIVPLVEVVGGPGTDPRIVNRVAELMRGLGMVVATLKRFVPGFIVNRIQRAIGREALYMIDEGIVEPEEIDRAIKASLGIRLPILGIFARYDFAGLDMAVNALKAPSIGLATEDRLSPTLSRLVEDGHLGVKSGRGFFDYGGRPLAEILKERDEKLMRMRDVLDELGEI
jgi:3-hydroxybutyryl-CoA dehydrogenase